MRAYGFWKSMLIYHAHTLVRAKRSVSQSFYSFSISTLLFLWKFFWNYDPLSYRERAQFAITLAASNSVTEKKKNTGSLDEGRISSPHNLSCSMLKWNICTSMEIHLHEHCKSNKYDSSWILNWINQQCFLGLSLCLCHTMPQEMGCWLLFSYAPNAGNASPSNHQTAMFALSEFSTLN